MRSSFIFRTTNSKKDLLVFGHNENYELGLGSDDNWNVREPTILKCPNKFSHFISISKGYDFVVAMTNKHECYIWGKDLLSPHKYIKVPTILECPDKDDYFVSVECGTNHLVALTFKKKCYVMGRNSNGQLGLGDNIDRKELTLLECPEKNSYFTQVACGAHHTIFLTNNKICYSCGGNLFGQLGIDLQCNSGKPFPVKSLGNHCVSIASGDYFSCVMTDDKEWHIWGSISDHITFRPEILIRPDIDEYYTKIFCGSSFLMALSNKNKTYVLGSNYDGELGLNLTSDRVDELTLLECPNGYFKDIYLGHNHVIAITDKNEVYRWGKIDYRITLFSKTKTQELKPTLFMREENGVEYSSFLPRDPFPIKIVRRITFPWSKKYIFSE